MYSEREHENSLKNITYPWNGGVGDLGPVREPELRRVELFSPLVYPVLQIILILLSLLTLGFIADSIDAERMTVIPSSDLVLRLMVVKLAFESLMDNDLAVPVPEVFPYDR
ncbi:hypothetical protein BDP27DRAFT_1360562 [Rhodocollybia butyracea]|uniref:Uncharacterized protein n=1 Tax=Rhodocollybia butyracea TaxID=206335 RepID=A0A9P5Q2U0_9AGAR|nr:hypothetical protein BDP27DRAFT_1360562 [Rhodocollybia butyracea]